MKKEDLLIYGGAALAGWMLWTNREALFGATVGASKYTAAANPESPWFNYKWGTLNLPGYSLFDGAMDSLGLTWTNYDQGGLGLKTGAANTGTGFYYAGLRL